ncbi:tetratricopeptide repeat protein [Paracraurococcus lichenis]|uniref:Tetratricopeptide repeat protein n=1 Tax=Paracraurococcus lichenis TaxID=3064888 RepID=A0ABT9DVV1_9PROT|nr:tetratricopeptide repeat protein [Paracraurococcus sp. LOR1-02]MDO9708017.1 tetratricopeptide repeat protein [Paracraurococcus sp. LOR1-02]
MHRPGIVLPVPLTRLFRAASRRRTARLIQAGDAARDRAAWPAAVAGYRRALARDPGLAPIWVQLGHALQEGGDADAAEQAYRRAIALEPDNPDTLLHLGHVVGRRGAFAEALGLITQGLRLAPEDALLRGERDRLLGLHGARLLQDLQEAVARRDPAPIAESVTALLDLPTPPLQPLIALIPAIEALDLPDSAALILRRAVAADLGTAEHALALAALQAREVRLAEAHDTLAGIMAREPMHGLARDALRAVKARRNRAMREEIAAARGIAPEAIPAGIRFVAIGTTGLCNASCVHCPTGKPVTAHVPRTPMPLDLYERILREMAGLHLTVDIQISLGLFGDALVDPHVVERARLIRRHLPDVEISVNTNGAAYNRARHQALRGTIDILALHVESLRPEAYAELMAPLRLERVRPKMDAILEDFGGLVQVSCPVSRLNLPELGEIRRHFLAAGAGGVHFDKLSSRCAEDRSVFDRLALTPVPNRCGPAALDDLIIDCDGLVMGCCFDFERLEPIGDLSRQPLLEVLLSPARQRMRAQMAEGRHAERQTCNRCWMDAEEVAIA